MSAPSRDLELPQVSEENICLPLSVNAVCLYWDVEIPMAEARRMATKYPRMNGTILVEGIELAESHGLWSAIHHSSMAGLKKVLDAGVPPIVILPGVRATVQHASVISGYDDSEGTILHYIPDAGSEGEYQLGVIPQSQFADIWSEDGMLLIALAPRELGESLPLGDAERARSNRLCFEAERLEIRGRREEAVAMLREALRLDADNSTAHSVLGAMLNTAGSEECVGHYRRAIEINARCYLAHRGLGNYYLKSKDYAAAERSYTEAISINATRFAPIYKNRGLARMYSGDNAGAKADFEEYVTSLPSAPDRKSVRETIAQL